ncbi:MAG: T9SS type A sorting domain-containing protein [Bernardetiaceae bacterium]|nr:T9SS type A sorting domain-containing protein [Bernardetiaceae bacterium]
MRRLYSLLSLFTLLFFSTQAYAQISLTDGDIYSENFDASDGGWTSGALTTALGPISGTSTFINPWEWGAPTSPPEIAPTPSTPNCWGTRLNANYDNSSLAALTSPSFDFSTLTSDPLLSFNIFHQTENGWDGTQVQISTDGGTTWSVLGTTVSPGGVNWYNRDAALIGTIPPTLTQTWSGTGTFASLFPTGWVTASHPLVGTAGESNVRIRYVFRSDGAVNGPGGTYIDDVTVIAGDYYDMVMQSIISPTTGALTATEVVEFEVLNSGNTTVTELEITYNITGPIASTFTEIVAVSIAPFATETVAFTTPANMSATGEYSVTVSVQVPGETDVFPANNSLTTTVIHLPTISTFPYEEDFNTDGGSWVPVNPAGVNCGEWGAPIADLPPVTGLVPLPGAPNCWGTLLNANYPDMNDVAHLESPVFDFSGLTDDPNLFFNMYSHIFNTGDGLQVQVSTDGGATYSLLGTIGSGINWYTTATPFIPAASPATLGLDMFTGGVWAGVSTFGAEAPVFGGWTTVGHPLTGLAGENNVRIRLSFFANAFTNRAGSYIDDILIFEGGYNDVIVTSIDEPNTGGGLGAETIEFTVQNNGTVAVSALEISYTVTGPIASSATETIAVAIPVGGSTSLSFSAPTDFSIEGEYNVSVTAVSTSPEIEVSPLNNTLAKAIIHIPTITSYPYQENFNTNGGSWVPVAGGGAGGASGIECWQWGEPINPITPQFLPIPDGPNCWGTIINGNYPNLGGTAFLESPIFDLSSFPVGEDPFILFDLFVMSENNWDLLQLQFSTDGGATYSGVVGAVGSGSNWYNRTGPPFGTLPSDIPAGTSYWSGQGTFTQLFPTGWVKAFHPLTGLAGENNVRLRFVFRSDLSGQGPGGAYIDNVAVRSGFYDGALLGFTAFPGANNGFGFTGIGLTATENYNVRVQNEGTEDITDITITYDVEGPINQSVSQDVAVSLETSDFIDVPSPNIDFSLPGFYQVTVTLTVNDGEDEVPANNVLTFLVENVLTVNTFPYFEDFEATPHSGWSRFAYIAAGGTNWERGTPSTPFINGAFSGTNAWATNLNSNYTENAGTALISPLFDFTSFTADAPPFINFANIFDTELGADGGTLLFTTDPTGLNPFTGGGASFIVGAVGQGANWFTSTTGATGLPQWDGRSEGWIQSIQSLAPFVGATGRFVFIFNSDAEINAEGWAIDDVFIGASGITDLALLDITAPNTGSNLDAAQPVTFALENVGADVIGETTLEFLLTGPTGTQIVSETVNLNLAPGATANYTFVQRADISFLGNYSIAGKVSAVGDINPLNDEAVKNFTHEQSANTDALPQLFAVAATDALTIDVVWGDSSSVETGFVLQRTDVGAMAADSSWNVIANLPANPTEQVDYLDAQVLPSKTYFYRVQYRFADGLSGYSNVDSARTPDLGGGEGIPEYEANLQGEPGNRSAILSWNTPLEEQFIRGFEIYGFDANFPTTIVGSTAGNSFVVENLINGMTYGFRIKPIFVDGSRGEFSNAAIVRPTIVLGNEAEQAVNTNIYPNPNDGSFRIRLNGAKSEMMTMTIVSVSGQVVYSKQIRQQNGSIDEEVSLPNVASGLYIVELRSETESFRHKISVVR